MARSKLTHPNGIANLSIAIDVNLKQALLEEIPDGKLSEWVVSLIRKELRRTSKNITIICMKCGHYQRIRKQYEESQRITCSNCGGKNRVGDASLPTP